MSIKILHIVPSYKPAYFYGGTIESVAKLCESLVQADIDVKVLTTSANGKEELDVSPGIEYEVEGVKVIYFRRQTKDNSHVTVSLWRALYKECKNYDIVHIHSWWNILVVVAAWICKKQKVKTIISPHGMLSNYIMANSNSKKKQLMHDAFGKQLLQHATFHATSKAEFLECKKLINGWDGFVLPNIIWLPKLDVVKRDNEIFTVIFLSRLHPKKGIELLMEAISKLTIEVRLQIAGTGEKLYEKQLKQRAKSLNIDHKIQWLGWQNREEKFDVLMQADLFALTSYNENFANVVVECLYAGTPVLLSRDVGLSYFVEKQKLGWICELNVDDIKSKLETAYNEKAERKRINKSAQPFIKEYFETGKLASAYIKKYESLINENAEVNAKA